MSMENLGPYSNFHELNQDWFLDEFNKVIAQWKAMQKKFDTLQDAFNDLKSYVQNYFKNLDVQEAINKKLDEMANQGFFTEIMSKFLNIFNISHNSEYAVNNISKVAISYISNKNLFTYGADYAAFRKTVIKNNGKWEINCSTFVMLCLFGISFENSKYNLNNNNRFTDFCELKELLEYYQSGDENDPSTWKYSSDIAKWCYDRGYCYTPNSDFSNVENGDVLFFNYYENAHNWNPFMNINHSAIWGYTRNDYVNLWEVSDIPRSNEYTISDLNNTKRKVVLCARLPFKGIRPNIVENPLINQSLSFKNVKTVSYNFLNHLKKNNYYTIALNYNGDDYLIIRDQDNNKIYSDYSNTYHAKEQIKTCIIYAENDITGINIIGNNNSNISVNGITCVEGIHTGYKELKNGYTNLNFLNVNDDTTFTISRNNNITKYIIKASKLKSGVNIICDVERYNAVLYEPLLCSVRRTTGTEIGNAYFTIDSKGTHIACRINDITNLEFILIEIFSI